MFKLKVLLAICLLANAGQAALITMDINAVCTEADYDPIDAGNELKIEYIVSNTTQSENSDDALYRVIIPAGINQSIYSVHVPENWVALVRSDEIELYTLNSYEDILCGETKSFTIYAHNTGKEQAHIQAMTSIGDWAIPVVADVPTGQVPEPATIFMLACGTCLLKRRN